MRGVASGAQLRLGLADAILMPGGLRMQARHDGEHAAAHLATRRGHEGRA